MQLPAGRKVPADPAAWKCDDTGVTENLWLNLSTGHIGSGRQVGGFRTFVLAPTTVDSQMLNKLLCAMFHEGRSAEVHTAGQLLSFISMKDRNTRLLTGP